LSLVRSIDHVEIPHDFRTDSIIKSANALQELTENEAAVRLLQHMEFGPGGTGKSRVMNALRDFFGRRNKTRRFQLAVYTGVAARNIGGAMLHSLL
jgi:hypothetical protein